MSNIRAKTTKSDIDILLNFVERSQGLRILSIDTNEIKIVQSVDHKIFTFSSLEIIEILHRNDSDSRAFLQVNFQNSNKVLLTETLVGFKPQQTLGLDMSKLPKVVTTPDLMSVYEAIEEALGSDQIDHETEILKKVYISIISGGEKVGFELVEERQWINRLLGSRLRASA